MDILLGEILHIYWKLFIVPRVAKCRINYDNVKNRALIVQLMINERKTIPVYEFYD